MSLNENQPADKWAGIPHDVKDCQWIDCAQHRADSGIPDASKAGVEEQSLEIPDATSDNAQAVLQKTRELIVRWELRRREVEGFAVRYAIKECADDLEKLLSSHSNAAGGLPLNPNPVSPEHILQMEREQWFPYPKVLPSEPGWYVVWVMPGEETVGYEPHFEQAFYTPSIDDWEPAAPCGPLADGCYLTHWRHINGPSVVSGNDAGAATRASSENSAASLVSSVERDGQKDLGIPGGTNAKHEPVTE